ncbi:Acyl carrier protein (AcpP) (PDB:1ACP) [Commensalibacter communis]|uniref:Acyl carrier protein (AcpP) n=1 Tax=Commensalibacter communis TaxID=2972786 RepID=A0A9W4X7D3_9PROT|nr:type I polyketide synthase [Commensalibacter communis]CAI3954351.1 Acyl carrier protein (AcpP) (PDB:1ACP) [Commensalibacter communis]CAI3955787.1 Acyl carrier protein (AcpP) (PDB:1ACP) [Commensalibacter communis]CAI3956157.1 Acyl carrier protein (AcpP) (PDB:1ACP) [Commensalibacter communis]CAI3957503.1 Acyl carrier protein (AcpP) (PDB:1ACP) [Commensalibacter communis]
MKILGDKQYSGEIAIIGIGCRFPGGIVDLSSFWEAVCGKKETVSEILPSRWNWKGAYDKDNTMIAKSFFKNGSFLTQPIDEFEPLFFGMSPKEAVQCDPQQRVLLEVAWEAMEEGGLVASHYAGKKVGVFVGIFATDWLIMQSSHYASEGNVETNFLATTASTTMISARLSYFFDFCGPSLALDTACSSSLTAIHLACQSLRDGDSDMAMAGGINIMLTPQSGSLVAKARFMAEDGKSKSFDAAADGYGRGEGCGVVILKRLEDAIEDGDKIHAVISGIGINQDGHNEGITVPSAVAQEKLIRSVAEQAKIDLKDIVYVEAHGTGTPVGDPLEAQAISNTIGKSRPQESPVIIGSVKANIGHLEAAAGVAGLIKACLCLEHKAVPPQANLKEPNPNIAFTDMNLRLVQDEVVPLTTTAQDLYAAVNSFGYGGSNANAIIRLPRKEEVATRINSEEAHLPSDNYILSLSTKQQPSLKLTAEAYAAFLRADNSPSIEDITYSVGKHRSFFQRHLVTFGKTKEEIAQKLEDFAQDKPNPDVVVGQQQIKTQTQPAFVFSGMGPQWWGMGQWLLKNGPAESLAIAKEIDGYFQELSGWSILAELQKTEEESRIHETAVAQPGIFTIQVCLAEALKLYGIQPSAIVGHSVGEAAAAYVAGALSLKDATTVIYHRSRLQQTFAGRGSMLAVGMPPSASAELIKDYEGDVAVAAINSPRSFTLSGSKENLEKIAAELEKRSEFNRFLKVELAYHNPIMADIRDEFEEAVENIEPKVPTIPLYSTVTGHICDDTFFHDASYWYRNLRQTVLFAEAITTMIHDSYSLFLEVGPHPVLSASVKECAATLNASVGTAYTFHRSEPEEKSLVKSLASLSAVGLELDWDKIVSGKRVDLPFYCWAKEVYLNESKQLRARRLAERVNPVLGNVDWSGSRGWLSELNINFMPWIVDHQLEGMKVFPGAAYIEAAIAAHAQLAADAPKEMQEPAIVEDIQFKKAMLIDGKFYPYITWSVDELTGRFLAFGRTENDSPNWELYSTALLRRTAPWNGDQIEDIEALKAKITEEVDVSFYYEKMHEFGMQYGPAFQTIKQLYRGNGVAFAHLKIAESEKDTIEDYYIHPTLLDGAFQLFGLLGAEKQVSDTTFVPVSIERVMYFGRHEGELYAYGGNVRRDDEFLIGDIYIYTPKGEPVAKITGLTVKELATERQKEAKRARWLYRYEWKDAEVTPLLGEIARIALITDNDAIADPLIAELESQGLTVLQGRLGEKSGSETDSIFNIRYGNEEDYKAFYSFVDIQKCRALVYLRKDNTKNNDAIGLSLVQELLCVTKSLPALEDKDITDNLRCVIITNGAEKVLEDENIEHLGQSSLRGFIRVFSLERPEVKPKMVDIDGNMNAVEIPVLAAEILSDDVEDDVALRKDKRFISRLVPYKHQENVTPIPYEEIKGKNLGFRLIPGRSGMLDQIHYETFERQKPPPGHIEVEVVTSSLNFKDLLKVMGLLPRSVVKGTFHQDGLGMEAATRIVAVGEGAEAAGYYVGDRVIISTKDCLASHVTFSVETSYAMHLDKNSTIREAHRYNLSEEDIERVRKELVFEIPDAEASTMPTVYSTAYHTLLDIADIQEGQTILVHSGSGGLGLAAISIAKMRKARIFATAGNEEKRQYLRDIGCEHVWNSRNLEFVDGVKEVTNGRGVDIVINSLSGEALQHSLSLVAPYGYFFEVGKRDIVEGKWLPMHAFNENITFRSMDLDRMLAQRPEEIIRMLAACTRHIMNREIVMPPCTVMPAAKATEAFRLLASAQHIGKVVLDFSDTTDLMVNPLPKEIPTVQENAAYLVTGAYGGMGLQLVQWLVSMGAKHLVLVGRSLKVEDETIQKALDILASHNITVHQMQADIVDYNSIKSVIEQATQLDVPLKGVFHCAAVIDDGVITNLDNERLSKVILPKAQGAWNLHELTKDMELDHFVLFSSATNLLGNIGQAAYVSANFFLDALAKYRKQIGLPALAIEWGAIDGGSMYQKDSRAAKNFETIGVTPIPIKEALSTISLLWKADQPCVGVLDIDWSKWFGVFPMTRSVGRYQELLTLGNSSYEQTEVLRQLNALPLEERLPFVVKNLIDILTKTLQIPPDSIDGNTRLTELGIDSLVGVELQIAISNTLGCEISLLQLMKEENLQDVGKVLLRKLKVSFESNESLILDSDAEESEEKTAMLEDSSSKEME